MFILMLINKLFFFIRRFLKVKDFLYFYTACINHLLTGFSTSFHCVGLFKEVKRLSILGSLFFCAN